MLHKVREVRGACCRCSENEEFTEDSVRLSTLLAAGAAGVSVYAPELCS